jgi:DNA polymerase epsilon subunit 1
MSSLIPGSFQPNHLLGHRRLYLQLSFRNVSDLLTVRREILPLAQSNGKKMDAVDAYAEVVHAEASMRVQVEGDSEGMAWGADLDAIGAKNAKDKDPREGIIDIREYDVPYYLRVAIDNGAQMSLITLSKLAHSFAEIRAGLWYAVTFMAGLPSFTPLPDRVKRADPVVMAYDIETTKAPLKFPDQAVDQVMMISYMVDGQGFLITNRDIVSEDIEDFEYTPKEGYEGPFTIFNEPDEVNISHMLVLTVLINFHYSLRPFFDSSNTLGLRSLPSWLPSTAIFSISLFSVRERKHMGLICSLRLDLRKTRRMNTRVALARIWIVFDG